MHNSLLLLQYQGHCKKRKFCSYLIILFLIENLGFEDLFKTENKVLGF